MKIYYTPKSVAAKIIFCFTLLSACCLLSTVLTGCSATIKEHVSVKPIQTSLPGYSISGQRITYSNQDIKLSILPLNPPETRKILIDKAHNNPLAEILTRPQYMVFLLDIENLSRAKIIYNPALTALHDSEMGFHKPLDYTDLYSLAGSLQNPEHTLNNMKGLFYDLSVTLEPGQQTSRLLLFSGIEEVIDKLMIEMKEVYIGTSTITLSFDFIAGGE